VSEPKRYNEEMVNISNGDPCGEIEFDYSASMVEAFEGRWVAWEDYAELKAEAERYRLASLRVDVSELHAQFNRALFDDTIAENARLKAEVERLTKAGDAMVDMVDWEVPYERRKKLEADWNAAKEGKPRA
jgi:hypothetical protein